LRHRHAIAHIQPLERELRVRGQLIQPRLLEGGIVVAVQVVQPHHLVAVGKEPLRDVKSDEASRAGNEGGHAFTTFSRPSRTSRVAFRVSTTRAACWTTLW